MGCNYWKCMKLDEEGICEDMGTECIENMCENYYECEACKKQSKEDCPHY
jgi:hypothetical protein